MLRVLGHPAHSVTTDICIRVHPTVDERFVNHILHVRAERVKAKTSIDSG